MDNIGTSIIGMLEKTLLTVVAALTVIATIQELLAIFDARKVQLADLLLLFLYTEVLGMVGAFYKSKKIPITLPLFIAMTALARLIILQGKEMDAIILLYEAKRREAMSQTARPLRNSYETPRKETTRSQSFPLMTISYPIQLILLSSLIDVPIPR